jgi:hypothetical protein
MRMFCLVKTIEFCGGKPALPFRPVIVVQQAKREYVAVVTARISVDV